MSQKSESSNAQSAPAPALTKVKDSPVLFLMTDRVRSLYTKASALLESQRYDEALSALRIQGHSDPWLRNLVGVCLLRKGRPAEAVAIYRPLVWAANGLVLRTDVPIEFKSNFATALLLQGQVSAAVSILNEVGENTHPAVEKLRGAIARWKAGLSFWGRWKHRLGIDSVQEIPLDFPAGDLP